MKKLVSIILSLSISIVLFMACSNDSAPPVVPIIPPVETSPVNFDFSNAKAVAHMGDVTSRAAEDSDEYVKILSDGTFEAAIKLTGTGTLSKIVGIYPSPTTSGEFFVVFDSKSYLSSGYTSQSIGQLICVHSDGTYDDVLKIENNTSSTWTNYLELTTSSLTFDQNGNLYFFATKRYDSNGNSITNAGQQIYQYKPSEKQLNKLVAAVEGTSYDRMQISSDSSLIFAQGKRWNNSTCTYFIRAIPVADAGNFVNIYYGDNYIQSTNWFYDDTVSKMYFIGRIGNVNGLYSFSRNANFNDGTLKCGNLSNIIPNYFNSFFSSEISANELLQKLSIFFISDFDFRIKKFSVWNTNSQSSEFIFSELNSNETLENENALNWLKENNQRQNDFLTNFNDIISYCFYLKGSINSRLSMNNFLFDTSESYYNYGNHYESRIAKISTNSKGVYAWGKTNNGLIFIHIADENGNYLYDAKTISLPLTGKVIEAKMYGTEIFMKYVLTNSNDAELGYHHIYSINCLNAQLKNYFDTFTNKNTMEVVSYSVGTDNLYFSFVNGLNVESYVIDLNTNTSRKLETNRKMLDVFAF